jgi:hypothetical protein
MVTDLLAAALEYTAVGVHVFPARIVVVDGAKQVNPIGSWRDVSTTNPDTLRRWFAPGERWATSSLCIDCGKSGLVVVDPDEGEGKNGLANWAAVVAEHDLPVTPVRVRTPGGGEHWYYREHSRRPVGNDSTGKVAPDVDVRGLGGFVIAWPSEDSRGAYGQPDIAAFPTLPIVADFVIDRMTTREHTPSATVATSPAPQPAKDDFWSEWKRREFTQEQAKAFCVPPLDTFRALRTPEDSGFNQKLNAVACIWSHFVPAFMNAAQAEQEIYDAAVVNRSVEWQGEAGVRSTIRSGLNQRSDPWKAVKLEDAAAAKPETMLRRGDFVGVRGRRRAEPAYMRRNDGVALLYPGKDSYLYAETESGKSWLAALIVRQCLDDGVPVMVVDFEEGDEIEYGTRLLDLGTTEAKLSDPSRFRYVMVDGRCTGDLLAEASDMSAAVVVIEGMSVAYDVYGWQVKENDSATAFRRTLVKPHLVAGRAVLTTDHVVKDRDNRGRYAIGGVMKLNAASGGAFLLVNIDGLAPGQRGASNLYVTKDRPGGVKRHGVPAGEKFDPQVKRIGTLVVDDSRAEVNFLDVKICAPAKTELMASAPNSLSDEVFAALLRIQSAGMVPSLRKMRAEITGYRDTAVDAEIERMLTRGQLIETIGPRSARVFDRVPDLEEES